MPDLRPHFGQQRKPVLQYVCLTVLFVAAMYYQIRLAHDIVRDTHVDVPYATTGTASAALELVLPEAQKAGLQQGDVLLAVNRTPYSGTSVLGEAISKAGPGDTIALTVQSRSGVHQVTLPVTPGASSLSKIIYDVLLNIVMPVGSVLLGFWVVLIRPRDRLAWLLLGLLLSFSQLLDAHKLAGWPSGLREAAMGYHAALGASWPMFMFLFGFFFPEPFPFWQRAGAWRKWMPWIVIAPLAIQGIANVVVSIGEMTNYAAVQSTYQWLVRYQTFFRIYAYSVVGFGFFSSIFTKSAMAISADARRRLSLLYWGTTAAMSPLLVLTVVELDSRQGIVRDIPSMGNLDRAAHAVDFPAHPCLRDRGAAGDGCPGCRPAGSAIRVGENRHTRACSSSPSRS